MPIQAALSPYPQQFHVIYNKLSLTHSLGAKTVILPPVSFVYISVDIYVIYIYKEDRLCLSVCLSLSLSVSMHSHSFQATKFKLHRIVNDSSGQVVEGFTILPYPQRGQKWRVNHSKNVISTCNRTVFKLKSSNFTGTSTTPRDRSWRGSRFYRTPRGIRNKGLITQKTLFRRAIAHFSS